MIAAVAIANQLPLYTCHPRDFQHIDGREVVTVPMPTLEDADG
jgi:predicted nucleic acid-binding protein